MPSLSHLFDAVAPIAAASPLAREARSVDKQAIHGFHCSHPTINSPQPTSLAGIVGSWAQSPLTEELDALPTLSVQMHATPLARICWHFWVGCVGVLPDILG